MAIRVAAYCRVSTDEMGQQESFYNQVDVYLKKVTANPDWVLVDIYADPAVSGTTENRPEFQRMLRDAEKRMFDLLLVKSISRFARNTLISVETVRYLQSFGIGVVFEEQNIDTSQPYSEMMLTILSAFAQEESRNTSERVKKGIRMRQARGEVNWNPLYGYTRVEDKDYVVVENEAEVVRRIFSDYIKGKMTHDIRDELNREGIPSPGGSTWRGQTINNVLRNERYTGNVLTSKTFVGNHIDHKRKKNNGEIEQFLITNHHAPIISREEYDYAKEIRRQRDENAYPYYGFLVCPKCGRRVTRRIPGWGCTCGKFYIARDRLDEAVLKAYRELDVSDVEDEATLEIKEEFPAMETVEYWWLKKLVDRISFNRDASYITVHWICGKETLMETRYFRMAVELRRFKATEERKEKKEAKKVKRINKTTATKAATSSTT